MEYQNDSVEEILEQLKSAHSEGGDRPDKAKVDEILSSLGLEKPAAKPAAPTAVEQQPTSAQPKPAAKPAAPAAAEKSAAPAGQKPMGKAPAPPPPRQPAKPQPEKAAKPVPPAPLRETPQQEIEDRAKSIFEESEGEFVRPSPDIFSGERIDRRQHADELIDEKFYEFFTSSVVMDKEELDRRLREEKRQRKQEKTAKTGLFGFLKNRRAEEDEMPEEAAPPKKAAPTPAAMPEDIFAARQAELAQEQSDAPAGAPAAVTPQPEEKRTAAQPATAPLEPLPAEHAVAIEPAAERATAQDGAATTGATVVTATAAPQGGDLPPEGETTQETLQAPVAKPQEPPTLPQEERDAAEEDEQATRVMPPVEPKVLDYVPEQEEPQEALPDYDSPADAPTVQADLKSLRTSLRLRLLVTVIFGVMGLYLSLTASFTGLPTMSILSPTGQPMIYLVANMVLLLAAMIINYNTIAGGLASLFTSPSPDLLPALATVGALVQCGAFLAAPEKFATANYTLFAGIAVLCLAGNTLGKGVTARMVAENFEMASAGFDHAAAYQVTSEELVKKVTDGLGEPRPQLVVSRPTALVRGFLRQSFSERRSDKAAKRLGIAALIVALACAGIAWYFSHEILTAISCFAGALCLCAPLSSTLVGALPAALMQGSAARVGAVVPGPSAVETLKNTNVVLVGARDLFPPSTVRLRGIKTFEKERIDLAILYAASILVEGCDTLRDIFLGVVEGRLDMLYPVENLTTEIGRGFTGWIDNNRVIVGNREMMKRHDIEIPSMDYENRYTGDDKRPIYLAVAGRLFGMFLVSYGPDEEMADTVEELRRGGISLLVKSSDFNISSELVAECYGIDASYVKVLADSEAAALAPSLSYLPESDGVMTHIGSFSSFIGGLRAAIAAAGAEHASSVVQASAVILALLLGLLLSVTTGLGSLSALAVLLYQLAWLILAVAVALTRHY